MFFTDRRPARWLGECAALAGLGLIGACSPASTRVDPTAPSGPTASADDRVARDDTPADRRGAPAAAARIAPPTGPASDWTAYRRRAAHRLVDASPGKSHLGPVEEPLLGIPVLQIDLHADGSVQRIVVLRHPKSAPDTVRLAEEAVRRAAPFGDVRHLPKPWRFTETFLFDEQRRFKPRSLDADD